MIVRPRPTAWGLLFILRGSVIPHIAAKVAVIVALSCVVAWLHARQWFAPGHLNAVPFSLFGLALSVFLGFRNNVCYDRWWEARKQWAELSAQCRSLARETAAVLSGAADAPRQARIVRRLIGFNHALVARLRGGDPLTAARPWLPDAES
ncbi:bestrophin family protein, partial [Bordetella pertussis]